MASYKVIQDIEAEDHILGPFSFRQFVYLLIALVFGYFSFLVTTKGVAFLLILFLPPFLFFGFLSLPLGRNQPTEVWALAVLRFILKPKKRIWDQSGVKELINITVPKKQQQQLTKTFNRQEIKNRLQNLSQTMDTRGWASTSISVVQNNLSLNQSSDLNDDDRLLNVNQNKYSSIDPYADQPDILDTENNSTANQISEIIDKQARLKKARLLEIISNTEPTEFPIETTIKQKQETIISDKLKNDLQQKKSSISRLHEISDLSPSTTNSQTPTSEPIKTVDQEKMTSQPKPDIINLSQQNNMTISSISREINKDDEEVVISLH